MVSLLFGQVIGFVPMLFSLVGHLTCRLLLLFLLFFFLAGLVFALQHTIIDISLITVDISLPQVFILGKPASGVWIMLTPI